MKKDSPTSVHVDLGERGKFCMAEMSRTTGASVAYHVREAVKQYAKKSGFSWDNVKEVVRGKPKKTGKTR